MRDETTDELVEVPQVLVPPSDTQSKWVIGVVSAAIVAMLAFFLAESYKSVQTQLYEHQSRLQALEVEMESQKRLMQRVEESYSRIEMKLDALRDEARKR